MGGGGRAGGCCRVSWGPASAGAALAPCCSSPGPLLAALVLPGDPLWSPHAQPGCWGQTGRDGPGAARQCLPGRDPTSAQRRVSRGRERFLLGHHFLWLLQKWFLEIPPTELWSASGKGRPGGGGGRARLSAPEYWRVQAEAAGSPSAPPSGDRQAGTQSVCTAGRWAALPRAPQPLGLAPSLTRTQPGLCLGRGLGPAGPPTPSPWGRRPESGRWPSATAPG